MLCAASKYQIAALSAACEAFLLHHLTVENAISLLRLADVLRWNNPSHIPPPPPPNFNPPLTLLTFLDKPLSRTSRDYNAVSLLLHLSDVLSLVKMKDAILAFVSQVTPLPSQSTYISHRPTPMPLINPLDTPPTLSLMITPAPPP